MKKIISILLAISILVGLTSVFIVDETEYAAIVRFGAIQRIEKTP